ncbi:gephyrin-like molybdotransferase Glp [Acidipropionibacterium virtanenii]|uniref:Molybdopterin molybdenumtransferase n=1 Tax=Acidipropionibacterium virtanenii TaxID=2057246 RepID=A0A344UY11_9ACTN|nr:gephyrin-like molybdotransferase Glp [Acidipropionibacterium virtanenii]AXE40159.1 Molybdopterin molybdenumtransferase 2 [Acidipropionibacterium virtanenii]
MTQSEQFVGIGEHRRLVMSLAHEPAVVEMPLERCLGLVSAEPVAARLPVPPFTNSAMDGFAVRFQDVSTARPDAPVRLPVTGDIPAGSAAGDPVETGTARRIMTGARMPAGADSVVKVERTDHAPGVVDAPAEVRIFQAPELGANVRHRGEDLQIGDPVMEAGRLLDGACLAAAASVGYGSLAVHPAPRVGVISTGSELSDAGSDLAAGRIPDSNGILLAGLVSEAGAVVAQRARVPDDPARLREVVAGWDVDLVITAGGISAGAYEVVRQALPELTFHKVAQQPGGPQGAGIVGATPVVALPGNPVSVFVSFHVYARPLIAAMRGLAVPVESPTVRATAGAGWRSPAEKTQFMPIRWESGEGEGGRVVPAHRLGSKSHLVATLPLVEGLAVVPVGVEAVEAGDGLEVLMTRGEV